jgi:dolichyl-phosphate-mannose--protein O-mannosyl transferase
MLRHIKTNQYLHSHKSEGKSKFNKEVTCFKEKKDSNNYWKIIYLDSIFV